MNHQLSFLDIEETQYGTKVSAKVDPKPLARRTDPETSKIAAQAVAEQLTETEQLFVTTLMKFSYPATAQEVADAAIRIESLDQVRAVSAKRETLRKRAGELTKPAFTKNDILRRPAVIRVAGERDCQATGNPAQTYEVIR